ncbi:MAG: hypothetical protein CL840_21675 [Crocinitomicaceae bacterium]|nr:hypothetical protein [Crocinitomicaceae bacterium]|tara:strand:+ start:4424 stop:4837 length:414 start_codon:yes stop_codon:yes gene_type:complete
MTWKEELKLKMQIDKKSIVIYCVIYFSWGMGMHFFGQWAEIARFTYWWQVITCYILYMVPISIFLRSFKWYEQYAYGLVAMGVLEFLGYALETSYAYPNNLLDQFFNTQNFSLGMALFFAAYFPLGNGLVKWVRGKL